MASKKEYIWNQKIQYFVTFLILVLGYQASIWELWTFTSPLWYKGNTYKYLAVCVHVCIIKNKTTEMS